MDPVPLLAHTHASFVDILASHLGKGRQHAGLFYEEVLRKGAPPCASHPAFLTAHSLLEQLHQLTILPKLELAGESSDGTTGKFLLRMDDGLEVEAVRIPMQSGGTLCISSQIGCRMGCTFCETGRMGLLRNLKTEEILSQVFAARHRLGFAFTNVVFMGMGEPFDNYDNVLRAARVLIDPRGFACGKRNVTISTSGKVEEIRRFAREEGEMPNLAVSINAPHDDLRSKLMPLNRKHAMQELYAALQDYNQHTGRQILAAYVLLKGINDSPACAEGLADFLQGLNVKVNIIPYNPQSRDRFQPPEITEIEKFTSILRQRGYHTLLRVTKGRRIMAGCGQLGNLQLRKRPRLSRSECTDEIEDVFE